MRLRYLIVARHGDYHHATGELTEKGRCDVLALRENLAPFLNGKSATLLASTKTRAAQSADLLASEGVVAELFDLLVSAGGVVPPLEEALKLIEPYLQECEVVVLVTHFEYAQHFPRHFGTEVLDTEFESKETPKGRAWVIDCEKKTCTLV